MPTGVTSSQFNANTGVVNIATANPHLDGTGTLGSVITGAKATGTSLGGTIVKSIIIKATVPTTQGMVRLFISDGSSFWLVKEVQIPDTTPSSILPAFSTTLTTSINLANGDMLYASTQNAESFNIIAFGMDYGSCDCNQTCDCGSQIQYGSNIGKVNVATANTKLDGNGTVGLVFTAPTNGNGNCGTNVKSLLIKAAQDVTQGMIRFFINDGTSNFLMSEVAVTPTTTNSGILPAFSASLRTNFSLKGGYSMYASTENAESFNIVSSGVDFVSCGCV